MKFSKSAKQGTIVGILTLTSMGCGNSFTSGLIKLPPGAQPQTEQKNKEDKAKEDQSKAGTPSPLRTCSLTTQTDEITEANESVPYPEAGKATSFQSSNGEVRIEIELAEKTEHMTVLLLENGKPISKVMESTGSTFSEGSQSLKESISFSGNTGSKYTLTCGRNQPAPAPSSTAETPATETPVTD